MVEILGIQEERSESGADRGGKSWVPAEET